MKKLLLAILAVVAILTGVACLDITPYPVLEDGDAAADAGVE